MHTQTDGSRLRPSQHRKAEAAVAAVAAWRVLNLRMKRSTESESEAIYRTTNTHCVQDCIQRSSTQKNQSQFLLHRPPIAFHCISFSSFFLSFLSLPPLIYILYIYIIFFLLLLNIVFIVLWACAWYSGIRSHFDFDIVCANQRMNRRRRRRRRKNRRRKKNEWNLHSINQNRNG